MAVEIGGQPLAAKIIVGIVVTRSNSIILGLVRAIKSPIVALSVCTSAPKISSALPRIREWHSRHSL
jgi:hypothetical protein